MSWGYDNIVPEQAPAEQAVQVEAAPAAAPATFTPEQLQLVAAASPDQQTQIAALLSQNLAPSELVAAVMNVLQPNGQAPIGNDIMVASPTGQGLSNDIGLIEQQQDQGRTTYTEQDLTLLKAKIENLVKTMPNATEQEIQQAVANFAPAELQQYAQGVAQQQLDAEKFNIFASRPADGAAQEQTGNGFGNLFAAVVGGAVAGTAVARMQGITAAPMDVVDLGSSTAYIASLANGFTPLQVPDVRDRSQTRTVG